MNQETPRQSGCLCLEGVHCRRGVKWCLEKSFYANSTVSASGLTRYASEMETEKGIVTMTFKKIVALLDDKHAVEIVREFAHPMKLFRCEKYAGSNFAPFEACERGEVSIGCLIRSADECMLRHERRIEVWVVNTLEDLRSIGDAETILYGFKLEREEEKEKKPMRERGIQSFDLFDNDQESIK